MTNNDVLRRLRFALKLSDAEVKRLCKTVGVEVIDEALVSWLAREGEPLFSPCPDQILEAMLDGYVLHKRGPPDPSRPPPPRARFDNNAILRKLRIALSYKDDDMLAVLAAGGMQLSASELSALFRAEGHKHYRPAGDQLLRAFLKGLTIKLRGVGGE